MSGKLLLNLAARIGADLQETYGCNTILVNDLSVGDCVTIVDFGFVLSNAWDNFSSGEKVTIRDLTKGNLEQFKYFIDHNQNTLNIYVYGRIIAEHKLDSQTYYLIRVFDSNFTDEENSEDIESKYAILRAIDINKSKSFNNQKWEERQSNPIQVPPGAVWIDKPEDFTSEEVEETKTLIKDIHDKKINFYNNINGYSTCPELEFRLDRYTMQNFYNEYDIANLSSGNFSTLVERIVNETEEEWEEFPTNTGIDDPQPVCSVLGGYFPPLSFELENDDNVYMYVDHMKMYQVISYDMTINMEINRLG